MNTDRFKFRVWDNENKFYLEPGSLLYDRTGKISGWYSKYIYTVEQCTGVKDKNGKQIFEGDVLKVPAFFGGFVNMRVFWNDSTCRWDLGYSGKRSTEKDMTVLVPELGNASEIIGNIHDMEIER